MDLPCMCRMCTARRTRQGCEREQEWTCQACAGCVLLEGLGRGVRGSRNGLAMHAGCVLLEAETGQGCTRKQEWTCHAGCTARRRDWLGVFEGAGMDLPCRVCTARSRDWAGVY
jgi:hypothetical protein